MSLVKALALAWHSADAVLHMTRPHKRVRMVWAGIGVGWSMYWLIQHYTRPPLYVVTNERRY